MSKHGSTFPSGLRVLLVDNDTGCLENLRCRLQQGCNYQVTPCVGANDALSLLLEKKDGFDIVLTNYSMPAMDGIQLLESIRSMEASTYELPVVLFSGDQDRDVVIRAIEKGACDFLLKPIGDETLKMMWQHVVRLNLGKQRTIDSNVSEVNHPERYGSAIRSSSCDAIASPSKGISKRKRGDRCDEENVNNAGTVAATEMKKSRLNWTPELQQKFLNAIDIIEQRKNPNRLLGINGSAANDGHALPREILTEMRKMGVTGLTKEQVASHLQKHQQHMNKEAESKAQGNTLPDLSYPTPGQYYSLPIGPMFAAPAADYQHLLPENCDCDCEVHYGVQPFSSYFFSSIGPEVGPLPVSRMTNQYALPHNQPIQSLMWSNQPMMVPAPRDSGSQQKPPEPPDAIKDGIPEPVPQTVKAEQPKFPSQSYPSGHSNTAGFDATAATTDYTSFGIGNVAASAARDEDFGLIGLEGLDLPWLKVFVDSSGSYHLIDGGNGFN